MGVNDVDKNETPVLSNSTSGFTLELAGLYFPMFLLKLVLNLSSSRIALLGLNRFLSVMYYITFPTTEGALRSLYIVLIIIRYLLRSQGFLMVLSESKCNINNLFRRFSVLLNCFGVLFNILAFFIKGCFILDIRQPRWFHGSILHSSPHI